MFKWVIDAVRGPDYKKNAANLMLCFGGKANITSIHMSADNETMKIFLVDKKNVSYPLIAEYKLENVVVVEEHVLRIRVKRRHIFNTYVALMDLLELED